MNSPSIQRDIAKVVDLQTSKAIIDDLGDETNFIFLLMNPRIYLIKIKWLLFYVMLTNMKV